MHFLQGLRRKGVDIDNGVPGNVSRLTQLFSMRAAAGIGIAASGVAASALTGVTASTGVTLPASPDHTGYDGLYGQVDAQNKINGQGRGARHHGHGAGQDQGSIPREGYPHRWREGYRRRAWLDCVAIPGATGAHLGYPPLALGFIGRVPTIIADYESGGLRHDPETGLAIGIVVANAQANNKKIVNADLWFGCAVLR